MSKNTRRCTAAASAPSSDARPQQEDEQHTNALLLMGMITTPQDLDILCGRVSGAFHHRGNQIYRELVNRNKELYAQCPKSEKTKISCSIVAAIRECNGCFLEQDANTNLWFDIGDKKAIEKTSQALREGRAVNRQQSIESSSEASPSPTAAAGISCAIPSQEVFVVPPSSASVAVADAAVAAADADAAPRPPLPVGGVEKEQQQKSSSQQSLLLDEELDEADVIMNLLLQDDKEGQSDKWWWW